MICNHTEETPSGDSSPVDSVRHILLDEDDRSASQRGRASDAFAPPDRWLSRIENAQDVIYDCDSQGHFTYVNPAAAAVMKYSERELLGRHYLSLIRPDYRARAVETYRRQLSELAANTYFEFPAITKTGDTVWLGQHVQPVYADDKLVGFQAIARNITARREAEEQLQRSEARYRMLVRGAPFGMYRTSADGAFLDVNPALATMLRYESPEEVLALSNAAAIYQDPSARRRLAQQCAQSGRIDGVEVQWKRKDGTAVMARLTGRAVLDELGAVAEYEVIAEDMSRRQELEDQLRQAQKMEAVGQLAGGIAHNFNNLLTAILGYTELLVARHNTDETDSGDLGEIQKAAERAAALTRQLLGFSRKRPSTLSDVDVNQAVIAVQNMLTPVIREDITLVCDLEPDTAFVHADSNEFEQVILNLVMNARDALPMGGNIQLEVRRIPMSSRDQALEAAIPPGQYVRIRVTDDGVGMTPDVRDRVFEPFFTTKEPGKGTGLGLASVYGFIRQTQGFISVDSEVGRGSTFTLHLPATAAARQAEAPVAALHARRPGGETVLVVEDEDAVRAIACRVLQREGYHVLEAATPRRARELFEEHPEIRLLLSDIVMPEMNGPALVQRLVAVRPDLLVIFMSGYADRTDLSVVTNPNVRFLSKPFQASALARSVAELLHSNQEKDVSHV